jgi:hypothetical protein
MATFVMEFPELGRLRLGRDRERVKDARDTKMEQMTLGELLYLALVEKTGKVSPQ